MRCLSYSLLWMLLLVAAMECGGCGHKPTYGGAQVGSEAIPGNYVVQNCYVFQYDTYTGTFAPSKRRPLFAVLWQARRAGSSSSNSQNLVTAIHDHAIAPALDRQAIYALQPDYSLKEVPLTPSEVEHLFAVKEAVVLHEDPVFRAKVAGELKVVEAPPAGPLGQSK